MVGQLRLAKQLTIMSSIHVLPLKLKHHNGTIAMRPIYVYSYLELINEICD